MVRGDSYLEAKNTYASSAVYRSYELKADAYAHARKPECPVGGDASTWYSSLNRHGLNVQPLARMTRLSPLDLSTIFPFNDYSVLSASSQSSRVSSNTFPSSPLMTRTPNISTSTSNRVLAWSPSTPVRVDCWLGRYRTHTELTS